MQDFFRDFFPQLNAKRRKLDKSEKICYITLSTLCAGEVKRKKMIRDTMSDRIVSAAEKIVISEGAGALNVRKILQSLGITNRVFYNRFHNVTDVLSIIYEKTVLKIRENLATAYDPERDFFDAVTDISVGTLIMSYKNKMKFNQYIFESDSRTQKNYEWWTSEIEKLIEYAKQRNYIDKRIDSHIMGYSIWCFIRGFNADAVARNMPLDEAVKKFRYSFSVLINGMKP